VQSESKRRSVASAGGRTPRRTQVDELLEEGAEFLHTTPQHLAEGDVAKIELRNRTVEQSQGSRSARTRSGQTEDEDDAQGGSAGTSRRQPVRSSARTRQSHLRSIPEDNKEQ
jgi:hypothetical protein